MSNYTVTALGEHDFWLEDSTKTPYPASFLTRPAAELAAIAINEYNANRVKASKEPVHITLDTTLATTPRQVIGYAQPLPRHNITLGGYAQKPDKQIVVAVKDEQEPTLTPKPKDRLVL